MNKSKSLQELNLINSFLFGASTEDPQNAEFIAKLIIERATGKKVSNVTVIQEKPLMGPDIGYHGIRMDLYVTESEKERRIRVYDIEPNRYGLEELPKRSRFSQALTDIKLLKSGEDYQNLPEYLSIWILTKDPFGKNQMIYSVKNCVEGFPEIVYNDGVKKIFLYAAGELGGNEALKALLKYLANSDKRNASDEEIKKLHTIVETVRNNRKVGEQYMTWQEVMEYEKKEAREEGLSEGRAEVIRTFVKKCSENRISELEIKQKLVNEIGLSDEEAEAYLKR